ncbi:MULTISPECIES: VCBS repeat-containing protein [unclassified Leeuwenhoekiella]|uniref:VCBS repeat-containing protein n=1 Tax=unclassified Leeuwenhoekiella TaxID=2615029 RepID=UPI0025C6B3EB|nr:MULTISPECIES: VCBS repeat-containing protein [unclassified Leeuwenhoekiella]
MLTAVEDTGIEFSNDLTNTTQLNILNYLYFYNGAGTAIADFNNDGLEDIYFTGNQVSDKLYLNQGSFKFKDISAEAGITNNNWNTGVTAVDINADGLLDIYICTVSGHLDLKGHNKLYINQGIKDGIPQFKEESEKYGLDYHGLSTQAAFFDYDLDGDLDVYVLNHSVHPNSNYGRANIRRVSDSLTGDRLYKNDNGYFTDVTSSAGILNSKIGYGLGVSVSDLNNDNYPDLYIANDFFENDYIYLNNRDGSFTEVNTTKNLLGHTSHFSMGSAIADINNDRNPDILSLDMLPQNLEVLKASGTEYTYPIYQNQLRNGYDYQFMQNALQLNLGGERFSEIAFQSGIAATEWSWSPLAADFDNDGFKDLYIANGILGATNDMDFVSFISNESIQKRLGKTMSEAELEFIKQLPQTHVPNYAYKNNGDGTFRDVTQSWTANSPSFSNGASYADLDNDGDLDIVVNNINAKAFILENKTTNPGIQVRFKGEKNNTYGIGAKLTAFSGDTVQFFENYTTTGFMSAVPPSVLIGLGNASQIDSLLVTWPSGKTQALKNIKTNLLVEEKNAQENPSPKPFEKPEISWVQDSLTLNFTHKDGASIEFSRDPLVPYAGTNTGPQIASTDLNQDGLDDMIILGAKAQKTVLFFQNKDGSFTEAFLPQADDDAINEDIAIAIFDADGNGTPDIAIASGGNEFTQGKALTPRLYLNENGNFTKIQGAFRNLNLNASTIKSVDLDGDGNLDLSITADLVPHEFGATPKQYLLKNDGSGNFTDITSSYAPEFQNIGNVKDIVWSDLDQNGYPDAIVAGQWMPISIFTNDGKRLKPVNTESLQNTNGLWNSLKVADFDKDGDLDIVAGNWGLNTRLHASVQEPLNLYRFDFDANGKIDPITTYFYKGTETVLATKDELVKQLPYLNKKFLSYHAFAKASITDLFSAEKLKKAEKKQVFTLASTYFENTGDFSFKASQLPFMAQITSVKNIVAHDFNEDGLQDLLLLGNDSEISTQLGRLDASHGVFLLNKGTTFEYEDAPNIDITGAVRSSTFFNLNEDPLLILGRNNDTPIFIRKATVHE